MKKILIVSVCICAIIALNSCSKSCTCVAPDNSVSEIEVTMLDDCSVQSNNVLGNCY